MRVKPNRNGRNIKTSTSNNKLPVKKPVKVNNAKLTDNSVLRPPIETSVSGLKQAVKLFETGTPEVLHLLTFECDVIYECRFCRNLFRSLANFISHKRVYCTRRFNHVEANTMAEDHTVFIGESAGASLPQRITAKQDLTSIMETSAAQYYKQVEDSVRCRNESRCDTTVHLQPIESTSCGVYQTVNNAVSATLMKNQVSELNEIIYSNEGVTLGPDGKIIRDVNTAVHAIKVKDEQPITSLTCTICKVKFSSKKTLSFHIKNTHENFRLCFTCPCCKNVFTNTWSVHRHLAKVHHKSQDQVRKLKLQIQRKQIRAEVLTKKSKKKMISTNKVRKDETYNHQSQSHSEVLICESCGRQFGRRSSLTTHTQVCHKRMKACHTLQSKQNDEKTAELLDSVAGASQNHQMQSEKRIGIQVRMNYCKNPSSIVTRRSERNKSCEDKDDDTNETLSNVSSTKDRVLWQSNESINRIKVEACRNSEDKACSPIGSGSNVSRSARANRVKKRRLEDISLQLRLAARQESDSPKKGSNKTAIVMSNDISTRNDHLRKSDSRTSKNSSNKSSINPKENAILSDSRNANSNQPSPLPCVNQTINESESQDNVSIKTLTENVSDNSIEKDCVGILTRYKVRSIFKPDGSTPENSMNENSREVELCNTTDESSLKENVNETHHEDFNDDQSNSIEKKLNQYVHFKNKQCLICLEKFKIWSHLKNHVGDHLGWNNFRCLFAECIYVTFSKSECIKHIMKTHLKAQERHRASSLVGEINQADKVNCDMGDKSRKRHSVSEDLKVVKDATSVEREQVEAVSVVSMNDTCDVAREECVQTSRNDSSCSEQSDMESKLLKRNSKRRKTLKCSPAAASATELIERNSKKCAAGVQFKDGKSISEIISKKPKS